MNIVRGRGVWVTTDRSSEIMEPLILKNPHNKFLCSCLNISCCHRARRTSKKSTGTPSSLECS